MKNARGYLKNERLIGKCAGLIETWRGYLKKSALIETCAGLIKKCAGLTNK
jgi:hypothetical protein